MKREKEKGREGRKVEDFPIVDGSPVWANLLGRPLLFWTCRLQQLYFYIQAEYNYIIVYYIIIILYYKLYLFIKANVLIEAMQKAMDGSEWSHNAQITIDSSRTINKMIKRHNEVKCPICRQLLMYM